MSLGAEYAKLTSSLASADTESESDGESAKKLSFYGEGPDAAKKRPPANKGWFFTQGQLCLIVFIGLLFIVVIALVAVIAQPHPHCARDLSSLSYNNGSPPSQEDSGNPPPSALPPIPFSWQNIRLPDVIEPLTYKIILEPNLTTSKCLGHVAITFKAHSPVKFTVLHSRKLNILDITATTSNGKAIDIVQHQFYEPYDQLFIEFASNIEPNEMHTLQIDFTKMLEENLDGFYLSSYTTSQGEKRYLATTHFEPTSARSAFPCYDEPAMKASFELVISHEANHTALFNSPLMKREEIPEKGHAISTFVPTMRMSTYLVAFVVSDFKAISKMAANKTINVTVYAPEEQLGQANFALETAVQILADYQEFFNISYPLQKLDMIAIPDFGPGAMENWGLITYRMTTILYNPEETSSESQEHVATVIAHELAHQWFGDLVTMKWWNDLWLNEGFASFIEFFGVGFVKPEWNMLDQFVLSVSQEALVLDSLYSSHPIMANVENPLDIEAIFDSISYKKGACLIYMLENLIGEDVLKKGLSSYLQTYRFDNAETGDLWDSFTKVYEIRNIGEIMETWTRQPGFPLISVNRLVGGSALWVNQTRFLLTPTNPLVSPCQVDCFSDSLWTVPLTYLTDASSTVCTQLLDKQASEIDANHQFKWIKFNVNQTGFYRVNYDASIWAALIDLLMTNHTCLSPPDRANLIDDAFTLVNAGLVHSHLALNLSLYLKQERDYVPWETALKHFDHIDLMLRDSPIHPIFEEFMIELMLPTLNSVGWQDEGSHLTKKLRSAILSAAVKYKHQPTIDEALKRYKGWMINKQTVEPNLRSVVYGAGIRHGGMADWNHCWKRYQTSQVPSEQRLLLAALGTTQDIWQLTQYLKASLDKELVRPQDVTTVIAMAAANPIGQLLTWHFVKTNWNTFYKLFGQGSFSMDYIITETVSSFTSHFDFFEVKTFFQTVDLGVGASALNHSLEHIWANALWKEKNQHAVEIWLQSHQGLSVATSSASPNSTDLAR